MKECKLCKCELNANAKICYHCGSDQRRFLRFIKDAGFTNMVAVVVLIFAFFQYNTARRENVLAREANASAQIALHKMDSLGSHVEQMVKLYAEISYIETTIYSITADGGITYPENFHTKLDSLMKIIEPDRLRRQGWIENLNRSK
jgi:hypothetical protein